MKAITSVITLVMLLLITVGLIGISYAWINGLFSSQTKNSISIPAGGAYCSNKNIKLYVLNNGNGPISANDVIVADIDGSSVINNGLIGYWKFNEGSGSTASDSSGNGNNGNLVNNPAWVSGKYTNALQFNGVNNYVTYGNIFDNSFTGSNAKFSIGAWIKSIGTNTNAAIVSKSGGGVQNEREIYFRVFTGGALEFLWYGDLTGNTYRGTLGTTNVDNKNWHHVAVTYDGTLPVNNRVSLYVDGVNEPTSIDLSAGSPSSIQSSGSQVVVADALSSTNIDQAEWYNGIIDDVRIYNRVLSPAEVKFLYGITPGDAALAIDYATGSGLHNVRIGTSSGIVQTSVNCA